MKRLNLVISANTGSVLVLALLVLSGCASHQVEYDKAPRIQSTESVAIEFSTIGAYSDGSPYAQKHVYGPASQREFVDGFAEILRTKGIFGDVHLKMTYEDESLTHSNKIEIKFFQSVMASPEPVLLVDVGLKIVGTNRIGLVNNYHIESGSKLDAFMDMSANGQKNSVSRQLADAAIYDIERYLDINKADTIEYSGVSLTFPKGEGWVLLPKNPQVTFDITVGKITGSPTHSFYVAANANSFSEIPDTQETFEKFVSALAVSSFTSARYTLLDSRIEGTDKLSEQSVRYHLLLEDRAAPNAAGEISYMEVTGYYFVSPEDAESIVNVFYSERYVKGETSPHLKSHGEKYLESIQAIR